MLSTGAATAATTPAGPVAVIKQATDDFNKGDMKAATAAFASDPAIVDEFAPYQWRGSGAVASWLDGYNAFLKSAGWSDEKVTISSVARSDVEGDAAYVVVREVVTYTQRGRPMRETGVQAYALHKGADGWKVTSAAWAGSHPQAVTPKPASGAAAPATGASPAAAPAKKP
jgi:hypothetical protein